MNEKDEERMLDLLCKQAIDGLSSAEESELRELENSGSSNIDLLSLEYTAAAISTLGVRPNDRLPDHLKSKILAAADEYFTPSGETNKRAIAEQKTRMPLLGWLGWAAAAAASVLLGLNILMSGSRGPDVVQNPPASTPETLSLAQKREQLLANLPPTEIVKAEWGAGNMKDVAIVGDVVWSDSKQEGYMRFRNLPRNDAGVSTYQLWIFDETQSEKTPIDGGTFDITADGEIIIPINAKLKARGPKAFAITVEKPGGVVVSDRKKIPALAAVKPNQA